MARRLALAALAAVLASTAWAQGFVGEGRIGGGVELRVDVARLSGLAASGQAGAVAGLTRDSSLLLFGSLSKPAVVSDEPYEAVAEFMEGRWVDGSRLELHRVFLVFRGGDFESFLGEAAGGQAAVLAVNARLVDGPEGPAAYLDVVSARALR